MYSFIFCKVISFDPHVWYYIFEFPIKLYEAEGKVYFCASDVGLVVSLCHTCVMKELRVEAVNRAGHSSGVSAQLQRRAWRLPQTRHAAGTCSPAGRGGRCGSRSAAAVFQTNESLRFGG